MKKLFVTLFATVAVAVAAIAQPSVGAGFLMPMNQGLSDNQLSGFYAGLNYNVRLAGPVGIAPGVYFNYATKSENSVDFKSMGVAVPVMLNVGLKLGDSFVIRPYAGPTVSYGFKEEASIGSISGNMYNVDEYKHLNVMVGGGLAFEFDNMVRFEVGYDYGLYKIYEALGSTLTRNQLHAGVAFIF